MARCVWLTRAGLVQNHGRIPCPCNALGGDDEEPGGGKEGDGDQDAGVLDCILGAALPGEPGPAHRCVLPDTPLALSRVLCAVMDWTPVLGVGYWPPAGLIPFYWLVKASLLFYMWELEGTKVIFGLLEKATVRTNMLLRETLGGALVLIGVVDWQASKKLA
jgi:hypothetical protein